MPIGLVSAEGIPIRRNSGKPKLLVRGRRRAAVIKALNSLTVLVNQEFSENRRSAINKYTPFFVLGPSTSKFNEWVGKIQEQLQKALDAKA